MDSASVCFNFQHLNLTSIFKVISPRCKCNESNVPEPVLHNRPESELRLNNENSYQVYIMENCVIQIVYSQALSNCGNDKILFPLRIQICTDYCYLKLTIQINRNSIHRGIKKNGKLSPKN